MCNRLIKINNELRIILYMVIMKYEHWIICHYTDVHKNNVVKWTLYLTMLSGITVYCEILMKIPYQ